MDFRTISGKCHLSSKNQAISFQNVTHVEVGVLISISIALQTIASTQTLFNIIQLLGGTTE